MKAEVLSNLMFSPVWIGKLLSSFISGAQKSAPRGIKFELIYLMIPMLYNEKTCDKLEKSIASSTLVSVFKDEEIKVLLIGMSELLSNFKNHTDKGLIVLSNNSGVNVGAYLSLDTVFNYNRESNLYLKKMYKSAFNLGRILAKEEPFEALIKVGLK